MSRSFASALLLILTLGCQSMRAKKSSDFIEPLSRQAISSDAKNKVPDSERELCIQTAKVVAARGHFTEAIALYEQAEKLNRDLPALDRELANLYAQSEQFDLSVKRYRLAIEKSPNDVDLRNNLAWTLLESNRLDQAIQVINESLKQFPQNRRLQSTQAIASYHAGDRQAAIQQFTSLYGPSAAYHNVALLDLESGNQQNARTAIDHAMVGAPTKQTIQLASAIKNGQHND